MSLSSSGDQPPCPLPSRVDTSTRVATPLKKYNIQDLNVGKSTFGSSATQPLTFSSTSGNQPPHPLPCRVDTSSRVATPLKIDDAYSLAKLPMRSNHVSVSSQLCETIHTSLKHSNQYSPSGAVNIISAWLDWLLFDLDTNSTQFLNWVVHDFCTELLCYKLDPTLAHAIWQCEVILQETVQETSSFYGIPFGADYKPRLLNFEQSNLVVGLPSLDLL
jgi:hypothetical protein